LGEPVIENQFPFLLVTAKAGEDKVCGTVIAATLDRHDVVE
jgi:hypothetical protein